MKLKLLHLFSATQSVFYFMEYQLQYMIDRDIEVHVILPMDNVYFPKIKKRDPAVHFHHVDLRREISPVTDLKSLWSIRKIIAQVIPDIIHLHTPKASFLGAMAAKSLGRKNIIYHIHGLVSANNASWKNPIYVLEKLTCQMASRILCVSDSIRQHAIDKKYCDSAKVSVIANGTVNGIDFQNRFSSDKLSISKYKDIRASEDEFIVGFVGRLSEAKGFFDYLQVCDTLVSSNPNLKAVIVGPNETQDKMTNVMSKYANLNSDNCILIGEINDPENVIFHFDLMLFPTHREGFGLVAAEANALGVPVVGYDIPGLRDAVENGTTATLVPVYNVPELSKAVKSFIDDENMLLEFGENGVSRVRRLFDGNLIREEVYNFYFKNFIIQSDRI
ncbi:glycosyltransferase [Saprospiraceae bacterium]|nr:glycosyltransferase [Saprospiraceae bacterium]